MSIRGRCHCGNITFTLSGERDEIPARACTCSFCTRNGGVWTSDPSSALEVGIEDPSLVSAYVFGTRTAQFHVCARCGAVPVVTSFIQDRLYAVVNVLAFEDVDPSRLRHGSASLDGEATEDRLARRKRNWIADVRIVDRAVETRAFDRGDVCWVAPDDANGHPHPHVVVQDDVFNRSRIATVVVCALTTNLHKAHEPGNVLLDVGEGGLPQRSVVVVSQIASLAKGRLGDRIGSLSATRVDQILSGLRFQQRSFFPR